MFFSPGKAFLSFVKLKQTLKLFLQENVALTLMVMQVLSWCDPVEQIRPILAFYVRV